MKLNSFRNRLLIFFLGLLALTSLITIIAVAHATNKNLKDITFKELQVAERVLLSLLEESSHQLRGRAELLANDFAFKKAMATKEEQTIISVLANHGDRINADLVLLMSETQEVVMTTHNVDALKSQFAKQQLNLATSDVLAVVEDNAYKIALVPIMAPDLIGWVGLGFKIDQLFLDSLKTTTNTDITLLFSAPGIKSRMKSTLPNHVTTASITENNSTNTKALAQTIQQLTDNEWLSRPVVILDESNQQLHVILSRSMHDTLQRYEPLRAQLILITSITLLLAAMATFFIAKGVTKPIELLVRSANRIANGEYTKPINLTTNNEFQMLGNTLNIMQEAVSDREMRIQHLAQYDGLTELPNRHHISTIISNRLLEKTPKLQFGLALVELTNLNQLKDVYGSEFSDELLKKVGGRLNALMRRGDFLGRNADIQFLLYFDSLDHKGIDKVIEKINLAFHSPFTSNEISVHIEIKSGLILCPQHGSTFDELLRRAQIALSKAQHSNQSFQLYQLGQDENHLRQIKITNRLIRAIQTNSFSLHYQPKYDLKKRKVTQVEALLRWEDEEMGRMFPDEFIPLAERSGNMTAISKLVLQEVLSQLVIWKEQNISLGISINLSGQDLIDKEFVRYFIDCFEASRVDASAIIVEVTETVMMADMDLAMENICLFNDANIALSMDDFGTGFSSLAQLKTLPVAELKIDKCLVTHLSHDVSDQKIVSSTISMAHHLGLSVIAEGVEDAEALKLLYKMECDSIQGYYLAKPMPVDDLEKWMATPPDHVVLIDALLG